jgi:hypothetical protein
MAAAEISSGVDADVLRRHLQCRRLGEPDHAALGRPVQTVLADTGHVAGYGSLVDDGAAAILTHLGDLMLHAVVDALQVDVDQGIELKEAAAPDG